MGPLGRATCTVHSISAQTSQEGIKCTKSKFLLLVLLSNLYTVKSGLEEKDKDMVEKIRDIYRNFSMKDAEEVKKIEKVVTFYLL